MTTQPFPNSLLRWGAAYTAGLAVFLFVVITATLVTFILPETYASSTRILLPPDKVVNITLGVVIGCLLGGSVAAGVLFLSREKRA